MLKNHFKFMFRNLWANKTFSFLNIFGLAIGIACAGLIFLWVEDETSFNNINVKKDRLYQLEVNMSVGGRSFTMGSTPRPMAAALQSEISGIAHAARYSDNEERRLFTFEDKSIYLSGRFTDPALFSMFTFDFVEGNANTPFPQYYTVVLTESSARKFFGEKGQAVGKIVRINNRHDYTVSGVIKDLPGNSTLQFDWLAPYERTITGGEDSTVRRGDATNWSSFGPYTFVELDQSANPSLVDHQLRDFISNKSSDRKSETFLFPMKDWRLYSEFANGKPTGGGRIQQVHLLSVLAWIILLIA
ncbi:MAG TPA: ABC transporter permease, partial [Puia sp.]|nr:ABC transporter permease [Puia sp.]